MQSPWNQGYRPGQLNSIGIEQPIIDYKQLIGVLEGIERTGVETLDGKQVNRYGGRVALADVPFFSGTSGATANVDVWLDSAGGLPVQVELSVTGSDGHLTINLDNYNQSLVAPAAPTSARPLRDVQFPNAACIGGALAACLEAQNDIAGAKSCTGDGRRVCLAPLGQISSDLVDHLVAYYREQYGLAVTVLSLSAIPSQLEDPQRQQIDASRLITYMGSLFPDAYRDSSVVLIGLTPVDLYDSTSHFRYLFGLKGTPADPKAVVSTLRMDPQFYSEPADRDLYYSRTRKLLSKYIGLLYYRLPTSSDPTSPMFDSILGPDDVDTMSEPLPVNSAH